MRSKPPPVCIIINPISGPTLPVLRGIAVAINEAGLTWEAKVTTKPEDVRSYAREALNQGFSTIAVYGGDGTVSQIASVLSHSSARLLILPGGTANVIAKELGLIKPVSQIFADYAANKLKVSQMDTYLVNGHRGLIRLNIGVFSEQVTRAQRQSKEQFGEITYAATGLTALRDSREVNYQFRVDGTEYAYPGIGLMITNIANAGYPNLHFSAQISPFDHKLNTLVLTGKDLTSLLRFTAQTLDSDKTHIPHLIGSTIEVEIPKGQAILLDDRPIDLKYATIKSDPASLAVYLPKGQ